jgi:hypothetical protein
MSIATNSSFCSPPGVSPSFLSESHCTVMCPADPGKSRRLATTPIDYEHSSARFYISSGHAGYEVTDIKEILKLPLSSSAETTAGTQVKE